MTTAKKTTAPRKSAKAEPSTVPGPAEQASGEKADQADISDPAEQASVDATVLREFNDLAAGVRRKVGDVFQCSPQRAAQIIAAHKAPLIAIGGAADE